MLSQRFRKANGSASLVCLMRYTILFFFLIKKNAVAPAPIPTIATETTIMTVFAVLFVGAVGATGLGSVSECPQAQLLMRFSPLSIHSPNVCSTFDASSTAPQKGQTFQ